MCFIDPLNGVGDGRRFLGFSGNLLPDGGGRLLLCGVCGAFIPPVDNLPYSSISLIGLKDPVLPLRASREALLLRFFERGCFFNL